jgi:hypothetical protein
MAHRKEFDMAVVDERTALLGRTASRLLIESIQQNQRGVPDDPMVFQVAGAYHDGLTLPARLFPAVSSANCCPEKCARS